MCNTGMRGRKLEGLSCGVAKLGHRLSYHLMRISWVVVTMQSALYTISHLILTTTPTFTVGETGLQRFSNLCSSSQPGSGRVRNPDRACLRAKPVFLGCSFQRVMWEMGPHVLGVGMRERLSCQQFGCFWTACITELMVVPLTDIENSR